LIGRAIADFIPGSGAKLVEQLRSDDGSRVVTRFDTDGDGTADVEVYQTPTTTTVSKNERNGDNLLLWSNPDGRINWTQYKGADGRFENILDQDNDGTPDLLARGHLNVLTLRLTGADAAREATRSRAGRGVDLGVDPSRLLMPHAALTPEQVVVRWDADIEKARVEVDIPFAAFVPALSDEQRSALATARPVNDWRGEQVSVTATAEGVRLVVDGAKGSAWMNGSPTLRLGESDQAVALFVPALLVDARANRQAALEHTLDALAQQQSLREKRLTEIDERLRFPERHLPQHSQLVALQDEATALKSVQDAKRPALLTALGANAVVLQATLAEVAAPGALVESVQAPLRDAKALLDSGAGPEAVFDALSARDALDIVLAWAEPALDGQRTFAAAHERAYVLNNSDLPMVESDLSAARAAFVAEQRRWRGMIAGELATVAEDARKATAALAKVPTEPPQQTSTDHVPYTQ
jgi:hypothetical protein